MTEEDENSRCMSKIRYSYIGARKVLRKFRHRRVKKTNIPLRCYFCKVCKHWHLTSKTSDASDMRKLRKRFKR